MPGQMRQIYRELGQVLNQPEAFGLGEWVPHPLAETLASTRRMLWQALQKQQLRLDGNVEAEWVQDANRVWSSAMGRFLF